MKKTFTLAVCACFLMTGCSTLTDEQMEYVAVFFGVTLAILAAATGDPNASDYLYTPSGSRSSSHSNDGHIHLFSGDQYLGCLSCSSHDSSSVWNDYGDFGSNYSSSSIWNEYGDYGGKYSRSSPWNTYGTNPPVVVDKSGNFYGYFTCDRYHSKRFNESFMDYVCENYHRVRNNKRQFSRSITR